MVIDNWKKDLTQYLPVVEEFLTSLLLEETNVEVDSTKEVEDEFLTEILNDDDIFLYTRELSNNADIIIVLDKVWFGLLSSIMLGIEEKEKNETTIGLFEEFSADLSQVILKKAEENEINAELGIIKILSRSEVLDLLAHKRYFWAHLEIEGVADDKVRAEFLMGDPETVIEKESEEDQAEGEKEADSVSLENDDSEDAFSPLETEEEREGKRENVISARQIEFAEFSENFGNGDAEAHSMDLLKDVELDVSVELGRIELPLGKVLQLAKGSVVELEKLAGEPVDILVNSNRIALGEVVVIDEHFGVRISSLVTTKKRLATIKNGS
ncbi:MAG TPA: flagellar motor switch protein FliN [Bacteroidales bacterium]|nr:flagellar motor switch protein FliN [Bacteroidales bacterium]